MRASRSLKFVAVAGVMAFLPACMSTGGSANPTSASGSARTARETATVVRPGFCPNGLDRLKIQPLPPNFEVGAAYECEEGFVDIAGRGQWSVEDEREASKGFGSLMSALRRPDQSPPATGVVCPTAFIIVPFALVATDGRIVRPKIPVDECNQPQSQVLAAIASLPWTVVHRQLLKQVETQAELASGCPVAYKDLFDLEASWLKPAVEGPPVKAPEPSITVCVYSDSDPAANHSDGQSVAGADVEVGDFVAGGPVDGPKETTLLQGIRAGRSTTSCIASHSRFATIIVKGGQPSTVIELGGCDRVLRWGYALGSPQTTANEGEVVGQATPQAVALVNALGNA